MCVPVLILILAHAYGVLTETSITPSWQPLDLNDPVGMLGNIPIPGFQRRKLEDGGGTLPLYLCLAVPDNYRITAGKLFMRPDGDFVCMATHYDREIALVSNAENYGKILVLTTPPECYTWQRYVRNVEFPKDWIQGATSIYQTPVAICRVYDPDFEVHIPGLMSGEACYYPYHGSRYGWENGQQKVDVLLWSDYALANPDQCTENGPTPIPEFVRRK